jgi:hypothetical protein
MCCADVAMGFAARSINSAPELGHLPTASVCCGNARLEDYRRLHGAPGVINAIAGYLGAGKGVVFPGGLLGRQERQSAAAADLLVNACRIRLYGLGHPTRNRVQVERESNCR